MKKIGILTLMFIFWGIKILFAQNPVIQQFPTIFDLNFFLQKVSKNNPLKDISFPDSIAFFKGQDDQWQFDYAIIAKNFDSIKNYPTKVFYINGRGDTLIKGDYSGMADFWKYAADFYENPENVYLFVDSCSEYIKTDDEQWINYYKLKRNPVPPYGLFFTEYKFLNWDENQQNFNFGYWFKYELDANNFLKSFVWLNFDSQFQIWRPLKKSDFITDENGYILQITNFDWIKQTASWKNSSKITYSYTDSYNILSETSYFWNDSLQYWQPEEKTNYEYENGLLKTKYIFIWNEEQNSWQYDKRTVFSYNSGNLITEELTQTFIQNQWQDEQKTVITYRNGLKTEKYHAIWEAALSKWIIQYQYIWNYDTLGRLKEFTYLLANDTNLVYSSRTLYTYNKTTTQKILVFQHWDENTQQWTNTSKNSNWFRDQKKIIEENYSWLNNSWIFTNRKTVRWRKIETPVKLQASAKIYPNPAKDVVFLPQGSTNIYIYSPNGKLSAFKKIQNNQINISELPQGVYIIEFQLNNKLQRKPLIKIK